MDGVLNMLKPPGMTSHDVVAAIRRIVRFKKVGHTGTLDPGVPGVLPICLGRATRLAEYLTDLGKSYRAEIAFGRATDTQDSFGATLAEADAGHLQESDLRAVLHRFTGTIWQVPPMVSAVKAGGQRLYDLARRGVEVPREPRQVQIYRLELREFRPGPLAVARLDADCSKGTYIRTLAADLGQALGVPAHLGYLVRTAAGPFALADAVTLDELAEHGAAPYLVPMAEAVSFLPRLAVDAEQAAGVRHGRSPRLPRGWAPPGPAAAGPVTVAVVDPAGDLLALAGWQAGPPPALRLLKVLSN